MTTGTPEKPTAREARENSVGWMFKRISARLDETMKAELQPLGLTIGQFAIIMTLLESENITQSEIGRRIMMPGYSTTRNIDALEEKGLLVRDRNETSRRSHSIRLTEKGKAQGPPLSEIAQRVTESLLSGMEPSDRKTLKDLLHSLVF